MTSSPGNETQSTCASNEVTANRKHLASRQILWLASGFGIWASALVVLYVLHSVGCAFGWSSDTIRLSLAAVLVVHVGLIGLLWRVQATRRPDPALGQIASFLHWIIIATLIAALAKIVFGLGPTLFLSVCA